MKVGFAQFAPVFGDKSANLSRVNRLIGKTRGGLIVLPELFNTGYAFTCKRELGKLAEPAEGPTALFLKALCRENDLCIVAGFAEQAEGRYYNSAVLVTRDGVQGVYRKAHLFMHEKHWFEPGDSGFTPFCCQGARIGILVCWDWIYPEAMRSLTVNGADIVCHCANLVLPYCQAAMVTRSIENRIFIITANRTGREKRGRFDFHFTGGSQIVAPGGRLLVRVRESQEALRTVDISPGTARNKKATRLNDLLADRRTDLYFRK